MATQERYPWTVEEDEALVDVIGQFGTSKWNVVTEKLRSCYGIAHRSGKQCRERWRKHLDPSIKREEWSEEEKEKLFAAHKELGNCWTEIAKRLPGRTDTAIKNYFYSSLRRSLRKYNKVQPQSKRINGSARTLLRNPKVVEILLDFQVPGRAKTVRKPVHGKKKEEDRSNSRRSPRLRAACEKNEEEIKEDNPQPSKATEDLVSASSESEDDDSDDEALLLMRLKEGNLPEEYLKKPKVEGSFIKFPTIPMLNFNSFVCPYSFPLGNNPKSK